MKWAKFFQVLKIVIDVIRQIDDAGVLDNVNHANVVKQTVNSLYRDATNHDPIKRRR